MSCICVALRTGTFIYLLTPSGRLSCISAPHVNMP